ncbi:MAG: hypothetical protein R3Y05_01440 [bacterium]
MKIVENYRVVVLDEYNYTWERHREVVCNATKDSPKRIETKWVQDGGYYRTLTGVLKAVKEAVTREEINNNVDHIDKVIDSLQGLEIKLEIITKGE